MSTKPRTPVDRRGDLRVLGTIAPLAVAVLVAAPIILILLVVQGQTGLSALPPVAALVATPVGFACLAFGTRPEGR